MWGLIAFAVVAGVVILALHWKGDVSAKVSCGLASFSIEAKEANRKDSSK